MNEDVFTMVQKVQITAAYAECLQLKRRRWIPIHDAEIELLHTGIREVRDEFRQFAEALLDLVRIYIDHIHDVMESVVEAVNDD